MHFLGMLNTTSGVKEGIFLYRRFETGRTRQIPRPKQDASLLSHDGVPIDTNNDEQFEKYG